MINIKVYTEKRKHKKINMYIYISGGSSGYANHALLIQKNIYYCYYLEHNVSFIILKSDFT